MRTSQFLRLKNSSAPVEPVAIVMTSYNRDFLLERAISSVINQKYINFTLYIVDDNSNKNTLAIIKRWAKLDRRIVVVKKRSTKADKATQATFCVNINHVLNYIIAENKKHKYITYITCDGFWYPDRLAILVYKMKKHKKMNNIYNQAQIGTLVGNSVRLTNRNIPERLNIVRNPMCVLDHETIFHKKNLLYKMKRPYWPEKKQHEATSPDGIFFTKLVKAGGPFYPVSQVLGIKLWHRNSIQGKAFNRIR